MISQSELKQLLSSKFDFDVWKPILEQMFLKIDYLTKEIQIDASLVKSGGQIGTIRLDDGRSLGLFKFEVADNIIIARNRKGLREIAAKYVDQDIIHGALVFYYSTQQPDYRLTFVSKQTVINANGEWEKKETAPKRYTFLLGENEPCTTAASRLHELIAKSSVYLADVTDAFSVERLNKEFFKAYKEQYQKFLKYLNADTKANRDYVKKMLGRLVFLHFLQKKGWMGVPMSNSKWEGGDKAYLLHLVEHNKGNNRLLTEVLEKLFFKTLNEKRTDDKADPLLGDNIKIPYLNGGLFDEDSLDKQNIDFPYAYFKDLMEFFAWYNFTIDENDPDDSEIGIDPEMLGHIFENLLEDNKDKGAFYTPKEIVQYMSRESVCQYLRTCTPDDLHATIDTLVKQKQVEPLLQNRENARLVNRALETVKVCDPAIGSGAFPMGVLNVLFDCRHLLYGFIGENKPFSYADIKKQIIQNNIYGVDIEQGAVDIARLRLWLALVVDENEPQPLPNLDYKIICGDSLLHRFVLDAPFQDVLKDYNRENNTNYTLDDYRQWVYDYTDISDHTQKDDFRNRIEEIKHAFKTELSKKEKTKIAKVRAAIANLQMEDLFGTNPKDKEKELKKLQKQLKTLEQQRDEIISNKIYEHAFEWRFEFPALLDSEGNFTGFDIVIGNPPYLKEGRISKLFFEPYKSSPYYMGKMDIWYMFACYGIDLLRKNGVLSFIATNNWTTSFGASILRDKVIKETRICNIIDFGSLMVFDSASIQTMIMLFQKDNKTDDYSFDYRKLLTHSATEKDAILLLTNMAKNAEYFEPTIRRGNWINRAITFSNNDDILEQINSGCDKLFLNDNELSNGIHPHYDFVNKKLAENYGLKIGDGIFGLSSIELKMLNLNEDENKLIKPYYNSSDNVERYYIGDTDIWIIYTPSSFKDPHSMDNLPHLKSHLDKYAGVITSDNKPYGLHRARVEDFFIGEKVVALRKCAGRPVFAYADGDNYMSATFYVIKTMRLNMKYLTGILNSRVIEFWLKNRGKMQGDNYQLDKEPLMRIPIAMPTLDIQNVIASLVDTIRLLRKSNISVDSHVTNDYLAKEFEKIINGCVYEIYFEEEIRKFFKESIIALVKGYISGSITSQNVYDVYSKIESTGIIEVIDSLGFSNSNTLRTISLS